MNLAKALFLTLLSTFLFSAMSVLVRLLGDVVPVGQLVFFRSAFAIVPVLVIYTWRGQFMDAVRTKRPFGQVGRGMLSIGGMFTNFASLSRLPLADAIAIQFASPLIVVALAGTFLKERIGIYRWSAVAVGFIGVLVMLVPHFDVRHYATIGAATALAGSLCAIASAFFNAGTVIQTRRLTQSEKTPSIVFYFSLMTMLAGACTLPFAWHTPDLPDLAMLMALGLIGGIAHIFLTESYRFAAASVVAPFSYSSLIWAVVLGYIVFGELPAPLVFVGAAIVTGAGLFVIWRERQLGLQRRREAETPPSP